MVRTYIRKGGHGGDRSKAGLPAGYWQEKGGRSWMRTNQSRLLSRLDKPLTTSMHRRMRKATK